MLSLRERRMLYSRVRLSSNRLYDHDVVPDAQAAAATLT